MLNATVRQSNVSTGSANVAAGMTDANKLNARLKEVFKERLSSFREAVYLLTGYKVRPSVPDDHCERFYNYRLVVGGRGRFPLLD